MIQKIGRYLDVDGDGYLVPDVSQDHIPPHWNALIQEVIDFVALHDQGNIKSIYVRGSVPRGLAIDGLSDLDLVFIVRDNQVKLDRHEFEKDLLQRYPFCTDIEWLASLESRFQPLPTGNLYPPIVAMLKTQGLHLWGHDYVAELPKMKPGRDVLAYAPHFNKEWFEFLEILPQHNSQQQFDKECRWMGKRILRASCELVTLAKPLFTRDLYLCYETTVDHFPEIQQPLYDVLKMTLQTNARPGEIIDTFTPVAEFLLPHCRPLQAA